MQGEAEQLAYHPNLNKAAGILRACAHPLRLQLLSIIHRHKSVNVNSIYSELNLEQSVTSQHLKILRDANLVLTKRIGKFIFYSVSYEQLSLIDSCLHKYF